MVNNYANNRSEHAMLFIISNW